MCVCVYIRIYLYTYIYMSMSIDVYIWHLFLNDMCACVYIRIYLYTYIYMSMSIDVYIWHLMICMHTEISNLKRFEQTELPAKLRDYFLQHTKSNINNISLLIHVFTIILCLFFSWILFFSFFGCMFLQFNDHIFDLIFFIYTYNYI